MNEHELDVIFFWDYLCYNVIVLTGQVIFVYF